MSTFRTPVGPQPPSVYWRRRILVLLGLIAVIVVVALIVFQPRGDTTTTTDPTATSSASPTVSAEAEEPAASVEPVAGAPCDPAAVSVTAITDSNNYAPEQQPQLSFSIASSSTVACTFNVGTTQQTFVVTSGEEQYWSSKDCETGAADSEITLEPNVAVTSTPLPWDRTRSSASTCDGQRTAVPAGGATYNLTVTVGAVQPSTASFIVN